MLKNDTARRAEHETVRNNVGFYDFTHQMVKVTGSDAADFLDRIYVNKVGSTEVNKAQYTTMLDEDAKILDDVIVFRLGENEYWISTLFVDQLMDWLNKHKDNFDVQFEEITDEVSMYAVQGPKSKKLLNKILNNPVDDLKFFNIEDNSIDDFDVKVAQAGFTGELGYEIYLHPDHTGKLEEKLLEQGKEYDVKDIETDVKLKSLPVENGLVLVSDVGGLTPLEALFSWSVDWDSDFIGKETLQKERENGSPYRLRGYTVQTDDDDVEIEEGEATVTYNGEEVGKVTSFTYGYTVENYIGFAVIDKEKVPKNETITIHSNGKEYEATSHDRTFYEGGVER